LSNCETCSEFYVTADFKVTKSKKQRVNIIGYQPKVAGDESNVTLANTASFNYTGVTVGVQTFTLTVVDNDGGACDGGSHG